MSASCWMGLVGDMAIPAEVDKIMRLTAIKNKVGRSFCQYLSLDIPTVVKVTQDKVDVIGWVDLTKFGVLNQKDVTKIGIWSEKILAKNPTGTLSQTVGTCSFQGP